MATAPFPHVRDPLNGGTAVGPWVSEQKPIGMTPLRGNPSLEITYLTTFIQPVGHIISGSR